MASVTEVEGAGFLSRKFILAVAVLTVASGFRVADLISAGDWLKCAIAVLTLYGLANVSQNVALGSQKAAIEAQKAIERARTGSVTA